MTFLSHDVDVRWILVIVAVAACAGAPPRPAPWQLAAPGLYLYPEVIEAYAPDDPGGYVVRPPAGASAAERAALIATLDPLDPDDVVGDGVVMRLEPAERDRVAAQAGVGAVEILQPEARLGPAGDGEVRVDLFAGASDAERDLVASWLEARGATVVWRGPAALRAQGAAPLRAELARLGPVRWVE